MHRVHENPSNINSMLPVLTIIFLYCYFNIEEVHQPWLAIQGEEVDPEEQDDQVERRRL